MQSRYELADTSPDPSSPSTTPEVLMTVAGVTPLPVASVPPPRLEQVRNAWKGKMGPASCPLSAELWPLNKCTEHLSCCACAVARRAGHFRDPCACCGTSYGDVLNSETESERMHHGLERKRILTVLVLQPTKRRHCNDSYGTGVPNPVPIAKEQNSGEQQIAGALMPEQLRVPDPEGHVGGRINSAK